MFGVWSWWSRFVLATPVDGGGGGEGYEGPLDIVADAVVAFGQRAMSAADRGSAVYTIREDGGDTTQSFSSDATTGAVSDAAITAFLDGADGFVTSWVNKGSSATDAVQADTGKQPQWEVVGGLPALFFDGLSNYLLTAGDVTVVDEWTVFAVLIPGSLEALVTSIRPVCGQTSPDYQNTGPDWCFEPFSGPGGYWITLVGDDTDYDNVLDVDIDNAPIEGFAETLHLVDCAISIASPDIFIDGVSQGVHDTGSSGTALGTISSPLAIGAGGQDVAGYGGHGFGHTLELLVFPGIVSPTDRLTLRQNIAAYYGITL